MDRGAGEPQSGPDHLAVPPPMGQKRLDGGVYGFIDIFIRAEHIHHGAMVYQFFR